VTTRLDPACPARCAVPSMALADREALCDIAEREELTVHDICQKVAACERRDGLLFTAALRSFITSYFRAAASAAKV
jgi:predicted DNA-binding ribbon-helix-helix protein